MAHAAPDVLLDTDALNFPLTKLLQGPAALEFGGLPKGGDRFGLIARVSVASFPEAGQEKSGLAILLLVHQFLDHPTREFMVLFDATPAGKQGGVVALGKSEARVARLFHQCGTFGDAFPVPVRGSQHEEAEIVSGSDVTKVIGLLVEGRRVLDVALGAATLLAPSSEYIEASSSTLGMTC